MSRPRTAIRRMSLGTGVPYGRPRSLGHVLIVPDNPTARRRMVDTVMDTLYGNPGLNRTITRDDIEYILATALCPADVGRRARRRKGHS